jgi:predicted metal-dependent hydrolase
MRDPSDLMNLLNLLFPVGKDFLISILKKQRTKLDGFEKSIINNTLSILFL